MKIKKIELNNIKCFKNTTLILSESINVIIGCNNSGKSTILDTIGSLQEPRKFNNNFARINCSAGNAKIYFNANTGMYYKNTFNYALIQTNGPSNNISIFENNRNKGNINILPAQDPGNYIIPFQSKRKVSAFSENITTPELNKVDGTLRNLYAKIDRISNPEYKPAYDEYIRACDQIIGFRISTTNSTNGKKGVYIIENDINIPIDSMGEGVTNLLGLIVDLCRVKNKLFIIEEPENDIHPKALNNLLNLINEKSKFNQFLITTHSNIVVQNLINNNKTKLFNVEMKFENKIPTSTIDEIDTIEKRIETLSNLGYSLLDHEMWEYWIIFEESSAERIIRDYFIRWFIPSFQSKIKTFSARSANEISIKFDDFNRLFVYLHLSPIYKNKAWVVIDAGENEQNILENIKDKYIKSGWNESQFIQLSKHNFEEYYPTRFQDKVSEILLETNKKNKRELKKQLLLDVIDWINLNEKDAMEEFTESANEIKIFLQSNFVNV